MDAKPFFSVEIVPADATTVHQKTVAGVNANYLAAAERKTTIFHLA